MTLERHIEDRGNKLLKAAGCVVLKLGQDGWPDRLVIWAPGRHFWIEWKSPTGALTKAQEKRVPRMRKMGESVYILERGGDALWALQEERRKPCR
jgi:hypothetical protein